MFPSFFCCERKAGRRILRLRFPHGSHFRPQSSIVLIKRCLSVGVKKLFDSFLQDRISFQSRMFSQKEFSFPLRRLHKSHIVHGVFHLVRYY